jgi:hypothetical protein
MLSVLALLAGASRSLGGRQHEFIVYTYSSERRHAAVRVVKVRWNLVLERRPDFPGCEAMEDVIIIGHDHE